MSKRGFEETLAQHGLYKKLTPEEEERERVRLKERYVRKQILDLLKDDEDDEG